MAFFGGYCIEVFMLVEDLRSLIHLLDMRCKATATERAISVICGRYRPIGEREFYECEPISVYSLEAYCFVQAALMKSLKSG